VTSAPWTVTITQKVCTWVATTQPNLAFTLTDALTTHSVTAFTASHASCPNTIAYTVTKSGGGVIDSAYMSFSNPTITLKAGTTVAQTTLLGAHNYITTGTLSNGGTVSSVAWTVTISQKDCTFTATT
jgi:plastocyanin